MAAALLVASCVFNNLLIFFFTSQANLIINVLFFEGNFLLDVLLLGADLQRLEAVDEVEVRQRVLLPVLLQRAQELVEEPEEQLVDARRAPLAARRRHELLEPGGRGTRGRR